MNASMTGTATTSHRTTLARPAARTRPASNKRIGWRVRRPKTDNAETFQASLVTAMGAAVSPKACCSSHHTCGIRVASTTRLHVLLAGAVGAARELSVLIHALGAFPQVVEDEEPRLGSHLPRGTIPRLHEPAKGFPARTDLPDSHVAAPAGRAPGRKHRPRAHFDVEAEVVDTREPQPGHVGRPLMPKVWASGESFLCPTTELLTQTVRHLAVFRPPPGSSAAARASVGSGRARSRATPA